MGKILIKLVLTGTFILLFFSSVFSKNIAIFSWENDGLAEKGFRDEIIKQFPDVRFYTFPCGKRDFLLDEYVGFFNRIYFDMIFVNGIIPAKALSKLGIPMIFYLKTDPVKEGLIADMKIPKSNATGITTKIPLIKQINALSEIKKIKKIGILREKADEDYFRSYEELKRLSDFFGFSAVELVVSGLLTEGSVLKDSALKDIDAIYIPYSQIPGVEVLDMINKNKIPTLSENQELVINNGALIAIVVDDYRGGRFAGKKAVDILSGGDSQNIPVTDIEHFMVVVNLSTASKIGIKIPVKFLIIADKIVR